MKKLYISDKDKRVFGVCGGMGEYWSVDPTVIRLLWIVVTIATGIIPGIVGYLVAGIVMPQHKETGEANHV